MNNILTMRQSLFDEGAPFWWEIITATFSITDVTIYACLLFFLGRPGQGNSGILELGTYLLGCKATLNFGRIPGVGGNSTRHHGFGTLPLKILRRQKFDHSADFPRISHRFPAENPLVTAVVSSRAAMAPGRASSRAPAPWWSLPPRPKASWGALDAGARGARW